MNYFLRNCAFSVVGVMLIFNFTAISRAQNVAVTDSAIYTPHNSAMLDVQSTKRGLLVPRLTTLQRNAIVSPAAGLLVYDITIGAYFTYNGTLWTNLTSGNADNVWSKNANTVFLSDTAYKVGIGVQDPKGKLVVKGNSNMSDTTVLFEVKDKKGNTVFAVYPTGAVLFVKEGAKGSASGFAVNARNTAKADSGLIMFITPDSARIYVKEDAKGNAGGFAVNARNTAKGANLSFLRVTSDSTRIYTGDSIKGFGVNNIGAGGKSSYMKMSPENYFIGHQAGNANNNGRFNSFIGFQSGYKNTSGNKNYFIGYRSGFNNLSGYSNVFIGDSAGFTNTSGLKNVFIGNQSGLYNTTGALNTAVGGESFRANTTGTWNAAFGNMALYSNTAGISNTAIGIGTLISNTTGCFNTAMGSSALGANTTEHFNVAVGGLSLNSLATGPGNTAVGTGALQYITAGIYNTALGYNAFQNSALNGNSTALGANAQITTSNKVRIGDATVLIIEGQVAYSFPSDGRFKNNVTEEVKGLDFITKLRPIVYNFDTKKFDEFVMKDVPDSLKKDLLAKKNYTESSTIRQTGFIAQEVEKAAQESGFVFNGVHHPINENDNYSIAYSLFTVPLVKAVQELNSRNMEQQKVIDSLQAKLDAQLKVNLELMQRMEAIEKKMENK